MIIPQLLGGLGFFRDVRFLGVLDEIRVIFPLPVREGRALWRVQVKGETPQTSLLRGDCHCRVELPWAWILGGPQKQQEGLKRDLSLPLL